MNDGLKKYQEFFEATYSDGAIDVKTKHLIALAASLAAGCEPWTQHCLAVARKHNATDEELNETMQIAMTVGATKIQIIQENALTALIHLDPEQETETEQNSNGSCVPWALSIRSGWAIDNEGLDKNMSLNDKIIRFRS